MAKTSTIQRASCVYENPSRTEFHNFRNHDGRWLPVKDRRIMERATLVILEDGTVVKDRKGTPIKTPTPKSRTRHLHLEGQTPVEISFDSGVVIRVRWDKAETAIKVAANEVRRDVLATEVVIRPRSANSFVMEVE